MTGPAGRCPRRLPGPEPAARPRHQLVRARPGWALAWQQTPLLLCLPPMCVCWWSCLPPVVWFVRRQQVQLAVRYVAGGAPWPCRRSLAVPARILRGEERPACDRHDGPGGNRHAEDGDQREDGDGVSGRAGRPGECEPLQG